MAGPSPTAPPASPPAGGTAYLLRPLVCTTLGLVANVLLTVGKIALGWLAGSAALVADGLHSLADVLSDIGIVFALKAANRPPDANHPYGHHSFETLGAVVVAGFMMVTAVTIGTGAVGRILVGQHARPEIVAFWAAVVSVVSKELMARWTLLAGRVHNSPALLANGAMHRSDALSSVAAAVGIGGAILSWPILDNLGALVIGLFIAKMGWDLLRENVMVLMDTMPDAALVAGIREAARGVPCVQEVRDLKARQRGSWLLADLRIAVHPDHTIESAHRIAHEVEDLVRREVPTVARVFVHVEPGLRVQAHRCPEPPDPALEDFTSGRPGSQARP